MTEIEFEDFKAVRAAHKSLCDGLTKRETDVLIYLSKGMTMREMGYLMKVSIYTVNDHIKCIYKKLDVESRPEAAVIACKAGLV